MFYQCPKCKKIWQYPIEKCLDCFLALERMENKKIKVIGVSRVIIPSLFHPKVPYWVLVLEDEQDNKWVQKSAKEYKIGDGFEVEKSEDKEAVVIWRIKYDFFEAIEKAIEILGVEVKENSKILILPSLSKASHSYFRDNTSPEFLGVALDFLFKKGVKPENIKFCAQSFDEIPIEAKAQKSGLLDVCLKNKVTLLDLSKTNFVKKEPPPSHHSSELRSDFYFEISEEVFKSDLFLNLPILKMSKAATSENIFFVLKKENYLAQKYLYSEKEIFEKLKQILPQYLTLAEANAVQSPEGFTQFLGLFLASFNPQNLDRVFFEITKKGQLPEILEGVDLEKIPIAGREIAEVLV